MDNVVFRGWSSTMGGWFSVPLRNTTSTARERYPDLLTISVSRWLLPDVKTDSPSPTLESVLPFTPLFRNKKELPVGFDLTNSDVLQPPETMIVRINA